MPEPMPGLAKMVETHILFQLELEMTAFKETPSKRGVKRALHKTIRAYENFRALSVQDLNDLLLEESISKWIDLLDASPLTKGE